MVPSAMRIVHGGFSLCALLLRGRGDYAAVQKRKVFSCPMLLLLLQRRSVG